jgi:hypothetical protein
MFYSTMKKGMPQVNRDSAQLRRDERGSRRGEHTFSSSSRI